MQRPVRRSIAAHGAGVVALRIEREHETVALLRAVDSAVAASKELMAGGLDDSRREQLRELVERGMRARSHLVVARLQDAESLARRLSQTCRGRRHSVEDLTQEALLGLLGAIETFDRQAAYRFDRYAGVLMHRAVLRFLENDARRRRESRDSAA